MTAGGLLALVITHVNCLPYMTPESASESSGGFPMQRETPHHFLCISRVVDSRLDDCEVPKRSSLATKLSTGMKGGFSFIFIFPLVCFCD